LGTHGHDHGITTPSGGFMGKTWDATGIAFDEKFWEIVFRKLRPGGIIKAFGGTRTFHKMVRAVRRAGFVDVQLEAWGYASGFPKSTNISKMIDKQAKAERKIVGYKRGVGGENMNDIVHGKEVRQTTDEGGRGVGAYGTGAKQVAIDVPITAPATELAALWDGFGTALKPAWEPIVVGRKP
jgi:site-specific DNA-methyltransferase (adenine-specific)